MKKGAEREWEFETIKPGKEGSCLCLPVNSFYILCTQYFEEPVEYQVDFLIEMENGEQHVQECDLLVYPDRIEVSGYDVKALGSTEYVVCVDTSESEWSREFSTTQILPAGETIRLPIFIVPQMSCNMSIRIEFETLDGKIIKAEPLKNAKFIVPYYEETMEQYVDGLNLDLNDKDSKKVVYFPFHKMKTVIPN